jgi:hypothetical protein
MSQYEERPEDERPDNDAEIPGVSDAALPLTDVTNAQEDGWAADLVGGPGEADTDDGAYGDGPDYDPAQQAVIEGGGGVSEGFEQSEEQLVRNATDSEGSTQRIIEDAFEEDAGPDEVEDRFGEADDAEPQ